MLPINKLLYSNQDLKAQSDFLMKNTFLCNTSMTILIKTVSIIYLKLFSLIII